MFINKLIFGTLVVVSLLEVGRGDADSDLNSNRSFAVDTVTLDNGLASNVSDPVDIISDSTFRHIGCFRKEPSGDVHVLNPTSFGTHQKSAEECSGNRCSTRFFAVVRGKTDSGRKQFSCLCFAEAPKDRIVFGNCPSSDAPQNRRMDVYFNLNVGTVCESPNTVAVRNFLTQEDDAKFGFDIVSGKFLDSPFELYAEECGTNIYEVQTEVSGKSEKLKSNVVLIKHFAKERRSELVSSIRAGVDASAGIYKGLVDVSGNVGFSANTELENMLKSSGAQEEESRLITSFGVIRKAEVRVIDFDNKRQFVTLTDTFFNLIRRYRDEGFKRSTADEIMTKYGHLIVTRGIFGGYYRERMTMTRTDFRKSSMSETELSFCFKEAISGGVDVLNGFIVGDASEEIEGCSSGFQNQLKELRNTYKAETLENEFVGGHIENGEFVVTPSEATLLTTEDKYPSGDDGIKFRLLSDFLYPEKISPLAVKESSIAEDQFGEIQSHLEGHIIEALREVNGTLAGCNCGVNAFAYLQTDLKCACYDFPSLCTNITSKSGIKPDRTPTFGDDPSVAAKIVRIEVYSGRYWFHTVVTKLKITYKGLNGKEFSRTYGNGGRRVGTVSFGPGLFLTALEVKVGAHVDYVAFHRSDNRKFGPYGGKTKESPSKRFKKDGSVIRSLFGKAGAVVDALGVFYETKTCCTTGSPIQTKSHLSGGGGGDHFDDSASISDIRKIREISVFAGLYKAHTVVSSLHITYELDDGSTVDEPHGHGGTLQDTISFDEFDLVEVQVKSGWYVDWIKFIRSDGKVFGKYGGKKDWGASIGGTFRQDNSTIKAFYGRDGAVIDALGVHYEADICVS